MPDPESVGNRSNISEQKGWNPMPWGEFNGVRKWFRANSQAARYERTGIDPDRAQEALNEAVRETPPAKALDESPLLGRMKIVRPK